MDEKRREEAIKYIKAQLENGYLNLGINEDDEIEIVKEAIECLWQNKLFGDYGSPKSGHSD